jgi:two-component system cell cycle response regulator
LARWRFAPRPAAQFHRHAARQLDVRALVDQKVAGHSEQVQRRFTSTRARRTSQNEATARFSYADELEENFQQKMHDAAIHDELTKACNKRQFLHQLNTEIAYAKRHATPLSLLMLDVDLFKQVNDRHGHLAGDYVLATLALIVRRTIRTEDLFARYGGEEFAILCRGITGGNALVLAERVRAEVETFVFDDKRQPIPVTVSVGVAYWFDQPDSATQLIADADAALYKAKEAGRNRVVVHAARAP